MCEMRRTIWPVGHGAFYTEVLNGLCEISVVYDCGGKGIKKQVKKFVSDCLPTPKNIDLLFISHFHWDHICGLKYLKQEGVTIKNIILPQTTNKSYALAEAYIYNACVGVNEEDNETIFVAQEFIRQYANNEVGDIHIIEVQKYGEGNDNNDPLIYDEGRVLNNKTLASGQSIKVKGIVHDCFWEYIPVNIYEEELVQKLGDELQKLSQNNPKHTSFFKNNGEIDLGALDEWLSDKEAKSLIWDVYQQVFGKGTNPNAYSMPVYSGPVGMPYHHFVVDSIIWPRLGFYGFDYDDHLLYNMPLLHDFRKRLCSCLYMGDFEPNNKYNNDTFVEILRTTLKDRWHYIGLQQIPHHASPNNYSDDLYDHPKLCFANVDNYKDRSCTFEVLQDIVQNDCFPIVITEKNEPLSFEIW